MSSSRLLLKNVCSSEQCRNRKFKTDSAFQLHLSYNAKCHEHFFNELRRCHLIENQPSSPSHRDRKRQRIGSPNAKLNSDELDQSEEWNDNNNLSDSSSISSHQSDESDSLLESIDDQADIESYPSIPLKGNSENESDDDSTIGINAHTIETMESLDVILDKLKNHRISLPVPSEYVPHTVDHDVCLQLIEMLHEMNCPDYAYKKL